MHELFKVWKNEKKTTTMFTRPIEPYQHVQGYINMFKVIFAIEVFFATQQLENGSNSQQLAEFQPKLATKVLMSKCQGNT